jgi:hypothetical protein
MEKKFLPKEKPILKEVQNQFKIWRNTKQKSEPIPEELWEAAVALTQDRSISAVGRALKLEYNELKRRVHAQRQINVGDATPQFIELSLTDPCPETYVELEDKSQNKMRVYSKGKADYKELVKIFWEKRV